MKLFMRYLKCRAGLLALLLVFFAFFALSFFLYQLPLKAVAYPSAVCAIVGAIAMAADYISVRKKHRELTELQTGVPVHLPGVNSIAEYDYRELVYAQWEKIAELQAAYDSRYWDMVDYYTAWVHQIKTPISSMYLALEREDTDQARQLKSELRRIEGYVDMVMAFLRLDSPSGDYVFREYELDGIVRRAVKRFAPEFIGRKIALEYEPLNTSVVTDEKWLGFVLEQVLSNALKYTEEGSVRIYLRPEKTLCIEDTGIGISASDLPRVFERGYTGYNGRMNQKASGLGLYLCRRICGKLCADISIRSQPGSGTVVSIDLEQYQLRKE